MASFNMNISLVEGISKETEYTGDDNTINKLWKLALDVLAKRPDVKSYYLRAQYDNPQRVVIREA